MPTQTYYILIQYVIDYYVDGYIFIKFLNKFYNLKVVTNNFKKNYSDLFENLINYNELLKDNIILTK